MVLVFTWLPALKVSTVSVDPTGVPARINDPLSDAVLLTAIVPTTSSFADGEVVPRPSLLVVELKKNSSDPVILDVPLKNATWLVAPVPLTAPTPLKEEHLHLLAPLSQERTSFNAQPPINLIPVAVTSSPELEAVIDVVPLVVASAVMVLPVLVKPSEKVSGDSYDKGAVVTDVNLPLLSTVITGTPVIDP